ncbi:MAG: bifunctional glycosyltransferase family 2/GtrA family protein [Bacilli bacterium]|nr:bifunctional glycosyltransferase family 2/GtrA family protein [Bacilli bacterium]
MKFALVIPIYQPCGKAYPFLSTISPDLFEKIIVVDDGSGADFKEEFDRIASLENFEVLSYPQNHGKGYALKYAFKHIKDNYPEIDGIVTADGDGQHTLEDILKVRDGIAENKGHLVLGIRDFDSPDCPPRNKAGNNFSRKYFKLVNRVEVKDTQTGLRGIPSSLFDLALDVHGDRYEYEWNFLAEAVRVAEGVTQIVINTIYDNNENSHFRAIRDSLRIFKQPITYILIAIASFLIDTGVFALAETLFARAEIGLPLIVIIPYISGRIISSPFNFLMNNFIVFPNSEGLGKKALKYTVICVLNMLLGLGILYLFDYCLYTIIDKNFGLVLLKIVVEIIIFIINFFISKAFVFARKKIKRD